MQLYLLLYKQAYRLLFHANLSFLTLFIATSLQAKRKSILLLYWHPPGYEQFDIGPVLNS